MVALIDDEDFDRVSHLKWHVAHSRGRWYAATTVKRSDGGQTTLRLHRFILRLPPRVPEVDHIDGNGLDCRKENTRLVTHGQNMQNRHGPHRNSQTGVRGVYLIKGRTAYRAGVRVDGQRIDLGCFKTLAAAEQAAIAGRRKYMTHAPECERAS